MKNHRATKIKTMKIKLLFIIVLFPFVSFAQDKAKIFQEFKSNYSFYWSGAKFLLGKTKIDPLVTNMIDKALPKIADQDVTGAITAITGIIAEKKNIKELNQKYVSYLEPQFNSLIKSIEKQDYVEILTTISDVALVSNDYLINNILPENNTTNKSALAVIDPLTLKELNNEKSSINHKEIISVLDSLNALQKPIKCVSFTNMGGWIILYGTDGFISSGIPKNASEKLHELHDKKVELNQISFTNAGGWVILYGKNGYSCKGIPVKASDKLHDLNSKNENINYISFSPDGGYVIVYNNSAYSSYLDEAINMELKTINQQSKEIKSVAFNENGGYAIIYGKDGFTSKGISKAASAELHDLHDKGKSFNYLTLLPNGGYAVIYNNYGFAYKSKE